MSEKKLTVFERLSSINVNDHVEKKDNLTYLSWAWAWSVTKKECPDASYSILPTDYDEDLGFMCHTSVTIEGQTLEMWLPVMDGKNKSMKKKAYTYSTKYGDKQVDAATTFDINKTMMRCLVKNLAMLDSESTSMPERICLKERVKRRQNRTPLQQQQLPKRKRQSLST